ncbi:hypothetical protein QBC40DRAFT_109630 [Triangularia verruculosa]|uniref:Uncharacterized protein n=1 Tax=Triangularia verruculosa TaxID=2587418 RepID=A0AAN7AS04_9PEZI|nr:hypothetical protein QBC40DRAFT_109630 [Triangularia verruculosa]
MASTTMPAIEITSPLDDEALIASHLPYQPFTMQPLEWHYVPADEHNQGSSSLIVAIWPTDTSYEGLQTICPPNTVPSAGRSGRSRQLQASQVMTTPLIHVPHCFLNVTSYTPDNRHTPGLVERVGLPRALVEGFLSSMRLPSSTANIVGLHAGAEVDLSTGVVPHIDDQDEWVFSRCLLADFTGFGEEAAATLSRQGRLCCWISVVLDASSGTWDINFVVHRVGVCARNPSLSKTGACVRSVD